MSVPKVFNYKIFSMDDLVFQLPTKSKDGTYVSRVYKQDERDCRILFQTPQLLAKDLIRTEPNHPSLSLSLENHHEDFINFLHAIDEYCIHFTARHSQSWFQKDFTPEIIDDFYQPTIKHAVCDDFSEQPYVEYGVPLYRKAPNINVYNDSRQLIQWSRIKEHVPVVAIVELKGLRFEQDKLICLWETVQLKASVGQNHVNLTECLHLNDSVQTPSHVDTPVLEVSKPTHPPNPPNSPNPSPSSKITSEAEVPRDNQDNQKNQKNQKTKKTENPPCSDDDGSLDDKDVSPTAPISKDSPDPLRSTTGSPRGSLQEAGSMPAKAESVVPQEGAYDRDVIDDDILKELAQGISINKQKMEDMSKQLNHLQEKANALQHFGISQR